MQEPFDKAGASSAPTAAGSGAPPATLPPELAALFHDLNQPLSAINNYAQAGTQLIDNGLADTAKLRELFGKIVAQCARASTLGQQLRASAARHTGKQA